MSKNEPSFGLEFSRLRRTNPRLQSKRNPYFLKKGLKFRQGSGETIPATFKQKQLSNSVQWLQFLSTTLSTHLYEKKKKERKKERKREGNVQERARKRVNEHATKTKRETSVAEQAANDESRSRAAEKLYSRLF